jgi:hypothetical protein
VLEEQSERSSSDVVQNFHPLVTEHPSKLADVDIFLERHERHERHLEKRETLEADRETLQSTHLTRLPKEEAWLEQSTDMQNEILKELQEAQTEAEELRKKWVTE